MILFSVSSSATYISLTSTVDMERLVNSTVAYANITLVNSGDEPAYEVVVEPMPPKDFVAEQISMGNINPNQTSIGTFKLTIPEDAIPGSYSVPILIRYADLNNYPFTFVTHLRFFYQLPLQSNILCVLPTDEIELVGENKATMQLKIQNQDEVEHQVTVKLHTPNQIAVQEKERVITLPASSETKLDFVISPLGALPGGSFFVFATVDYEEDGRHYSVISTPGRITTSKETPWVSMIAPVIAVVVILLVLVLIYMQFRKEKPISPAKPQLKPTVKGNK
jgi:hypothetical protein